MPIYPIDPAAQAAVSGQNIPHPQIGQGLDQYAAMLREDQQKQATIVDAVGKQTPGFLAYLTANHPDIISEISGQPRMFRQQGETPLPQRLQAAMQAFMSQPAPAETPLNAEQSVGLNKYIMERLDNEPNVRTMTPEQKAQLGLLMHHGLTATDPADRERAWEGVYGALGTKPTPEMQKFRAANEVLSDPGLGYTEPNERAALAASAATDQHVPSAHELDNIALDGLIKGRQLTKDDLDIELKRQELANKAIEAKNGQKIPQKEVEFFGNLGSVLKQTDRAIADLKGIGPVGTTMGYLFHAPAYNVKAAEVNAALSTLSVTFERLGLQLPGRVSPQLIDMLKGALVDYSKTPTQLHGILANSLDVLTDIYDSRLEEMERSGIANPDYYAKERAMLKHYADLAATMHFDKKWTPTPATFVQKTKEMFGFGGPGVSSDGSIPSTEDFLKGTNAEE